MQQMCVYSSKNLLTILSISASVKILYSKYPSTKDRVIGLAEATFEKKTPFYFHTSCQMHTCSDKPSYQKY